MDLESDSVDDARRLYVKKESLVRTNGRAKKSGKTTERRKAPRLSDRGSLRVDRGGRRERLYERKRANQERPPTDAGPARKALAALDSMGFCVMILPGRPERLYELKASESRKTTDGRGTR